MKIAAVYDVKNWAFYHMSRGIQKYAPPGCTVKLMDIEEYRHYSPLIKNEPTAILRLTRYCHQERRALRMVTLLASHALPYTQHDPRNLQTLGVTQERCLCGTIETLRNADGILVLNRELELALAPQCPVPMVRIPQGIDCSIFHCKPIRRTGPLVVGWCGQQTGFGESHFKGYREILHPLQLAVKRDKLPVRWVLNTRDYTKAIPQEKMADWYRSLDVFLCTSFGEGGPLTVFEAAACGCAVISTPVGIVKDWHDQTSGMPCSCRPDLVEWTVPVGRGDVHGIINQFAQKIRGLSRDKIQAEAAERSAYIADHYSWRVLAPKWLEFAVRGLT
jgi:hypothetical protein